MARIPSEFGRPREGIRPSTSRPMCDIWLVLLAVVLAAAFGALSALSIVGWWVRW